VTIARGGRVDAEVLAGSLVVAGYVDGVVRARSLLELLETASATGELIAPQIAVAVGAQLKAKVNTKTAAAALEVARHRGMLEQVP
jgi:cytoskeletal protein CcmA (bactofilin family)